MSKKNRQFQLTALKILNLVSETIHKSYISRCSCAVTKY
jgi:hypothetical protein